MKIEEEINPTSMYDYFAGLFNAKQIEGIENINTKNVTNMAGMCYMCKNLTSLDLSHFDTSKVTRMDNMFQYCIALTSLDVSHFDTSKVTNMNGMFANCYNLINIDVSNFNTSNVTTMRNMFANCYNLTNIDVSHFDTSKVTDMYAMFNKCLVLTALNVSHFDTSNVTNMDNMFNQCRTITVLDISRFNTSNVTTMSGMFYGCSNLTKIYAGDGWSTSAVTESTIMFLYSNKLVGAIAYDSTKTDANYANWATGYLTYKAKNLSEYQNLEYIESSGTQYMDTGVIPDSMTRFNIKASTKGVSGHTGLFGSRTSSGTEYFLSYIENSYGSSNNVIRVDVPGKTGDTGKRWSADLPFTIDIDCIAKKVKIDNEEITSYNNATYNPNSGVAISLFAVRQGASYLYPIAGRIYFCKIYSNGTLVRDFVPCKVKADNSIGLYDRLTGIFYANRGTGEFTPGANV